MLILNPGAVSFGGSTWERVTGVWIDRQAAREVVEWSDLGPHVVMADVPEQRVEIRVRQWMSREDPSSPRPGDQGELVVFTSVSAGDAGRARISATAVVVAVEHEVDESSATRTITMVAVSADGAADPVSVT